MRLFLILLIYMFSNTAFAISSVEEAFLQAGIKTTDTLETKIDKTLSLLNEKHYFTPNSNIKIPPQYSSNRYHLDSLRTPEEILSQKIGGYCGSKALAFAAILNFSGISLDDIQIVESVLNDDLRLICPKVGKARESHPRTGAAGHVFVAIRFPQNKWIIINTIDRPKTYERADWYSPTDIKNKIINQAVAIPREAYKELPPNYNSGLTVFQSWALSEVPIHTFEQRLDLIASGTINQTPGIFLDC